MWWTCHLRDKIAGGPARLPAEKTPSSLLGWPQVAKNHILVPKIQRSFDRAAKNLVLSRKLALLLSPLLLCCRLSFRLFRALHCLGIVRPPYALFLWLAKGVRMQVVSALCQRLFLLHRTAVGVGIGIVANSCHLPGGLSPGVPAGDFEMISTNFLGNVEVWTRRSDRSELVTKVSIQSFKPIGNCTTASPLPSRMAMPL